MPGLLKLPWVQQAEHWSYCRSVNSPATWHHRTGTRVTPRAEVGLRSHAVTVQDDVVHLLTGSTP